MTVIPRNSKKISAIFARVKSAQYCNQTTNCQLRDYTENLDQLQQTLKETTFARFYQTAPNLYAIALGSTQIYLTTADSLV